MVFLWLFIKFIKASCCKHKYGDDIFYKNVEGLASLKLSIIRFYGFYLFHHYGNITKYKRTDLYYNFYDFCLSRDYRNITKFCRSIYFELTWEPFLRLPFKVELPTNNLWDISSLFLKSIWTKNTVARLSGFP